MNAELQKAREWDLQYGRLLSDIQRHFPKFKLFWDNKNNIWSIMISPGVAVGLCNRETPIKDGIDLTDLEDYVNYITQMIALIIRYGGTDGYSD